MALQVPGAQIRISYIKLAILNTSLQTPKKGEVVVGWDLDDAGLLYYKSKIGDGVQNLRDLPYFTGRTYPYDTVVSKTVGGLIRGVSLFGMTIEEIIELLKSGYDNVSVDALSISPSIHEVGVPFSENVTVVPTLSNSYNAATGASANLSASKLIINPIGVDPLGTITAPGTGLALNDPQDIAITLSVVGKKGEVSNKSGVLQIGAPVYYGGFIGKETLAVSDFASMTKTLKRSIGGDYSFNAGRVFLAICNKIGSPTAFVGINTVLNTPMFGMDMQYQGDLIQNNGYIDLTYKVYCSTYEFLGTSKVRIG